MSDEPDPLLDVARNLRAIVELSGLLHDQAASRAAHKEIPGGDATVCLGPVSSIVDFERRGELVEYVWEATKHREGYQPWVDNDDNWEPPLQTLLFWSEAWRWEHEVLIDARPTVEGEAGWLSDMLGWAYDNEPHWDDFAADMANARRRLEALLYAGERDEHGIVRCACGCRLDRLADERHDCACLPLPTPADHAEHGACPCRRIESITVERIARVGQDDAVMVVATIREATEPHVHQRRGLCCLACRREAIHARHDQGGLRDRWVCSGCARVYDREDYDELIARDALDNATALPAVMMLARFPDVTYGNLRVLVTRGKVHKHGFDELGRVLYDVADVQRHVEAQVVGEAG